MKRREITAGAIILLLMVLSIPLAASSAPDDVLSLQPDHDYTINSANDVPGGAGGDDLVVTGQVVGELCTATQESFLKFDLSNVTTPITDAKLLLRSDFASVANTLTMGVFTSSDETWKDEVGFTWAGRPRKVEATALASASKTPVNGEVVFSSAALAAALEAQRASGANPKLVTLVITAVDCSGFSTTQSMDSRDKTAGVSPVLTLYFPAYGRHGAHLLSADPAVNWPLIAGMGALVAVVIGGLVMSRRRAAER